MISGLGEWERAIHKQRFTSHTGMVYAEAPTTICHSEGAKRPKNLGGEPGAAWVKDNPGHRVLTSLRRKPVNVLQVSGVRMRKERLRSPNGPERTIDRNPEIEEDLHYRGCFILSFTISASRYGSR